MTRFNYCFTVQEDSLKSIISHSPVSYNEICICPTPRSCLSEEHLTSVTMQSSIFQMQIPFSVNKYCLWSLILYLWNIFRTVDVFLVNEMCYYLDGEVGKRDHGAQNALESIQKTSQRYWGICHEDIISGTFETSDCDGCPRYIAFNFHS